MEKLNKEIRVERSWFERFVPEITIGGMTQQVDYVEVPDLETLSKILKEYILEDKVIVDVITQKFTTEISGDVLAVIIVYLTGLNLGKANEK